MSATFPSRFASSLTTFATPASSASWPRQLFLVVASTILVAASSWIAIPLSPVPITLQSLAVAGIALALGRRLATAAMIAYLVEGACGLPVFAGGASGLHVLMGPTGGYLAGFVLTALMVGSAADRGWTQGIVGRACAMLAAHVVIFAMGGLWLAAFVGTESALRLGVAPFLMGTLVKVAFGTFAPATIGALVGAARRPRVDG